jgi:hypothetical protein
MMKNSLLWSLVLGFLPAIAGGAAFLIIIILFKPPLWMLLGVVIGFSIYANIRQKSGFFATIRSAALNTLFFLFVYFLWVMIGFRGFLGLLVACVIVAAIILWRKRKLFISTIRTIEQTIWGRTHDRKRK